MAEQWDVVVVGSGPNGLSAALTLVSEGLSVLVLEAAETIGGGARTEPRGESGYLHDICSAIHPMGIASPLFRALQLEEHGEIEWVHAPVPLAHPFDDGTAAELLVSLEKTAAGLGRDEKAYLDLLAPFQRRAESMVNAILRPIRIPRHPLLMARFGVKGLQSCARLVTRHFTEERSRAIFAGCAAHSVVPLDRMATASFGLALHLTAHYAGWPILRGGSISIINALARRFRDGGGEIRTGQRVRSLAELPPHRAVLFDLTPRQIAAIAGDALPSRFSRRYARYRYGPGVFKIDWTLDGPIPWKAEACRRAATVHVAGTWEDIAESESQVANGSHPERPFVLVAQQSQFDSTRAPAGKQTGWAYCHVPHGSTVDMTARIEAQIERMAPGFGDLIRTRVTMNPAELHEHNPNMIGGDIGGGANDLRQFVMRPIARWNPYTTPNPTLFIGSSSTPPGGGVHGMCGYWAARTVLRNVFSRRPSAAYRL